LIEKIDDGSCAFMTDDWGGFTRILDENRHFTGKDLTFPIEATNSDIRHSLARFVRKTKASSRCYKMVNASIALYHHYQQPENRNNALKTLIPSFG
jgi:IS1 family transposase